MTEKSKEVEKGQTKVPERTQDTTLVDFRTAVENAEQQASNGNGSEPSKNNLGRMLDPVADRHVLRCAKCGHFLADQITYRCFTKMLCRQAECKALNEVTVDGNDIHIRVTPREARARGTMRV